VATAARLGLVVCSVSLLAHLNSCMLAIFVPEVMECFSDPIFKYFEVFSMTYISLTSVGPATLVFSCGGHITHLPAYRVVQIIISSENIFLTGMACAYAMTQFARLWDQDAAQASLVKENALKHLKEHCVSGETQMCVTESLEETRKMGTLKRHFNEVTGELPLPLVRRICKEMWDSKLDTLELIRHVATWSSDFLPDLVTLVQEELVASQMVLFDADDPSCNTLYIIEDVLHCPDDEEEGLH
jgi:hypothetical protein